MSEYTAEDFASVRFAESSTGGTASRNITTGVWRTSRGAALTNNQMAELDWWTPVQEPESPELTVDFLRETWKNAEVITSSNLPREGDMLIIQDAGSDSYTIGQWKAEWNNPKGVIGDRIFRRASRPKGAKEIEALLVSCQNSDMTMTAVADRLAEHFMEEKNND